jgi:hypothetical protein
MQKHLSEVTNALGKNRKDERYEYLLRLLNHEMTVQNSLLPEMTFNGQSAFENGDVSNSDLVAASAWLDQLKAHYNRKWNSANKEKEKYVGTQIAGGPEDDARYRQLLDDHSNESLTDLVCNANDLYRIIERDGRLIQRVNPIYQDPTSPVLRAHFLASRKLLGNMYIDTYWANVLVLWLMTLTLVITLYADALSRVLNFFEELMEKFTSKREG